MKLECLATYTLWGNVMSLASVKSPSTGRDLLLVSFREAKLSVLQYDLQTNNLITLSMHYFEEDDMKVKSSVYLRHYVCKFTGFVSVVCNSYFFRYMYVYEGRRLDR